jgi:hypothetical protein
VEYWSWIGFSITAIMAILAIKSPFPLFPPFLCLPRRAVGIGGLAFDFNQKSPIKNHKSTTMYRHHN